MQGASLVVREIDSVHAAQATKHALEILFFSGSELIVGLARGDRSVRVFLNVRMTPESAELVRNLLRPQNEIDTARLDRVARHTGESSRLRLLRKRDSACLLDGTHTARTVGIAAREHDTDRRAPTLFRERDEERVYRQMQAAARRATFEMKTLTVESQGGIGRNDVHMRRLNGQIVLDLHDRHQRLLRQQLRQQARVRGVEMLYEDVGHLPLSRQRRQ